MRIVSTFAAALLLPVAISTVPLFGQATGAAPNALTKEEKAQGWKLLFDGKSMKGWQDVRKQTPPGDSWTIEEACLKSVAHPKLREDLFTQKTFGNFELSFEWKISPNGNSGLKYRIQDRFWVDERRIKEFKRFEALANDAATQRATKRADGTQEYIVGFEYQVIDSSGHPDAKRGAYYQAGALYGMLPAGQKAEKPVGEFNHSRILVQGNKIEHWLNGVKVVDGQLDDEAVKQKVAARWTTTSPIYLNLANQPQKRTPIALQNHGDAAWFRSIKIRELP